MSTTVSYKGVTITEVNNNTKILETAGTWLEDDITLVDVTSGGGGITPTGTKQISITENGTITEDVTNYANAEITVNVSSGGTDTLGEMLGNTLTTYTNNTVTSIPSHAFANVTSLQNIELGAVSQIKTNAFQYCTNLISAKFVSATELSNLCFDGCSKLPLIVLPNFNHSNTATLRGCSLLKTVDLGNSNSSSSGAYIGQQVFQNDTVLDTIVLRFPFTITLQNVNSFNNTPFASGGTGGTIYVPSSLISSYQSANNWSTLYGYGTVTFTAIEGSIYEAAYADGTPIS